MTFDFHKSVKQFNVAAGTIKAEGQEFDAREVAFYTGMQCEELAEKLSALGFASEAGPLNDLGNLLKDGMYDDLVGLANRHDLLDADIDIQVVTEGAILASGANGDGARREVCRANNDKAVDGKLVRDPDSGKVLKPEGWVPPNLNPFVFGGSEAVPAPETIRGIPVAKLDAALAFVMPHSDLDADTTIADYLRELLTKLWNQGEGFDSKRPFGNSGWEGDITGALAAGGFVKGLQDDGYWVANDESANDMVFALITRLTAR